MLTNEAIEERAWIGLSALRELLADKRREVEGSLYPISISDSAFDFLHRAALLAAMVSANQATLIEAVADASDAEVRARRREAVWHDLTVLSDLLDSLAQKLSRQAREMRDVREHASRAAMAE